MVPAAARLAVHAAERARLSRRPVQLDVLIGTEIIAICVVPVACLPVAALVGIRWPYHPLQLHYRWDHRVPLRRMIVRWLILAVVP